MLIVCVWAARGLGKGSSLLLLYDIQPRKLLSNNDAKSKRDTFYVMLYISLQDV